MQVHEILTIFYGLSCHSTAELDACMKIFELHLWCSMHAIIQHLNDQ